MGTDCKSQLPTPASFSRNSDVLASPPSLGNASAVCKAWQALLFSLPSCSAWQGCRKKGVALCF